MKPIENDVSIPQPNPRLNENANADNKIRLDFALEQNRQAEAYIFNLENGIAINKQIILALLKDNVTNKQSAEAIKKLNAENANLYTLIKQLVNEREEIQGRLLISEQIIQNYKKQEEKLLKDVEKEKRELVDQLNRKEFVLQKVENRYERALQILSSMATKDQEVRKELKDLKADRRSKFKLTNVIEENERLRKELAQEKDLVKALTTQLNAAKSAALLLNSKSTINTQMKLKSSMECKKPNKSLMGLTTDNKNAKSKEVAELSKKIMELYRINITLSDALREASKYITSRRSRNQKSISCYTDDNLMRNFSNLGEKEQGVNNNLSFKEDLNGSVKDKKV
eukprot:TRINITY_DN11963_c0_g1_i12.p1 TRINITY_DN11963_c0_g1~~TRINITY_DN11963_c0_g1_i12.p1  ORF type:complete len:341 (-),score=87.70 TRINITY_DN11963_c0_g1_i12:110-1132(-)